MKWGLYSGTHESARLIVECEADTYDEADEKLSEIPSDGGLREVRQMAQEGECVVGRHYPKTGPILSEEDL